MMTGAPLSPKDAKKYFEADNADSLQDSLKNSEWWGLGAKHFNLDGAVHKAEFDNLCDGKDPQGIKTLRGEAHNGEPVAGTDTTFSAPKSVSLAALVGGDERLIEAHREAVKVTLDIMAKRYWMTREKGRWIPAKSPIVALYHHDTSRTLCPQLHTHCFWMNLAQKEDGNWDSSWQSIINKPFFRQKHLLGQIYRNELQRLCQDLGYETVYSPENNMWELKGYTREQIMHFSQRSQQIAAKLDELGLPDTVENKVYCLFKTRPKKNKTINREDLTSYWIRSGEEVNLIHPIPKSGINNKLDLTELIDEALRHCSERRSVFPIETVEEYCTLHPTGHKIADITDAILNHPKVIIRGTPVEGEQTLKGNLATEESLEREKKTIKLMLDGKDTCSPISFKITSDVLTPEQLSAVNLALTTKDRVIGWVGVAGAGKTFSVSEFLKFCPEIEVTGLAPDAAAAEVLKKETGIDTDTVAALLASKPKANGKRRLVIVDEAGKLSALDAHKLLERSKAEGFQLLLIGDPKQLSAVEAGSPFKALIENGMATAKLNNFKRQVDPLLNRAVQMIYYDWGPESIKLLDDRGWVLEEKDFDSRMLLVAQKWLDSERYNTRILAGTHKEREAITKLLRDVLKKEGHIGSMDYDLTVLRNKDLTREQMQHARNYNVGDIIVPDTYNNGLKESKQYKVLDIKGDVLTLVHKEGIRTLDLSKKTSDLKARVYKPHVIGISKGDRLKWTRNNKTLGRINGKEFTVTNIERDIVSIRYEDGLRDQFSLIQMGYVDHALVGTVYSSQGMTCENVLVTMGYDPTVSKEAILVAMSRAKNEAQFICADKEVLYERVERSRAQPNILDWLEEKHFKLIAPEPPDHIDIKNWKERIEESGVLPKIAELSIESLEGEDVYERLLEHRAEKLGSQYNTVPIQELKEWYAPVAEGGVWNFGGKDATELPKIKPGDKVKDKSWGEFKPLNPLVDTKKSKPDKVKFRKYESPLDIPKGIYLPEVPNDIAEIIYKRYGIEPTALQKQSGFWACVYWHEKIDIFIVEGKKKAEALLSQGYCALAVPSCSGGYRSKDSNGNVLPKRILHEELKVFTDNQRIFNLAFDRDFSNSTQEDVRRDLVRTGELIEEFGCTAKVIKWKGVKGPDDYIVKRGVRSWNERVENRSPLEWESEIHYKNEYEKLKNVVEKRNGKAPTQTKLDIAIGFIADTQDQAKILAQSPLLKEFSIDEKDRKLYVDGIINKAQELEKSINNRPKPKVDKPVVKNTLKI